MSFDEIQAKSAIQHFGKGRLMPAERNIFEGVELLSKIVGSTGITSKPMLRHSGQTSHRYKAMLFVSRISCKVCVKTSPTKNVIS